MLPEPSAILEWDDIHITCRRANGLVERLEWVKLQAVYLETDDSGPFACDVCWLLVGTDSGMVIPCGAQGEDSLLQRLQQLPGFDNEAVIEAMKTTEERRFLCWKRHE